MSRIKQLLIIKILFFSFEVIFKEEENMFGYWYYGSLKDDLKKTVLEHSSR